LEQCFPTSKYAYLHVVIALGEELNFTKAALRLNLTQPAWIENLAS
jgi:DNA-binding transcriptional LysR family regulator